MTLIVAGNVDPQAIVGCAEKFCGDWKPSGGKTNRVRPAVHSGQDVLCAERFKQQVVALSFPSVSATDPRIETAAAAAVILGGENSRFFWNIVQKGLAPRAGAHHLDYADCGLMILFASGPPERAEEFLDAMRAEIARLMREGVTEGEVSRVKNKELTSLAVEAEAPYYRLTQLIEDLEYHGRPRTVEESLAEVNAVSVETIRDYLAAFPLDRGGHLTSVGPRNWPATGG